MRKDKRLTKAQKAVAVAKDVLSSLNRRKLVQGYYIEGGLPKGVPCNDSDLELQQFVDKFEKNCSVCLLGSCLLSKAKVFDDVKLRILNIYCDDDETDGELTFGFNFHQDEMYDELKDIFSKDQMVLMEAAFETNHDIVIDMASDNGVSAEDVQAAINFGDSYPSKKLRVKAVMENVIANRGKFVIPDEFYDNNDDEAETTNDALSCTT